MALPVRAESVSKAISLHMWPAYLNAYRNKVPGTDGKMVFDRLSKNFSTIKTQALRILPLGAFVR
jgi:hypothetical protein